MPIQPFSRSRSCDILDDDSIDDNVACSFVSKLDEYNHEVGHTTEMEVKEHFERQVTLRLLYSNSVNRGGNVEPSVKWSWSHGMMGCPHEGFREGQELDLRNT